jgi:hypothetical protein
MRNLIGCVTLGLIAATPAQSQIFVQTPWAAVRVGPPAPTRVLVQTPWATIGVNLPPPAAPAGTSSAAPADLVYEPGAPPPVPLPIPVESHTSRVPSLSEFAATFQAKPGHFEVLIAHPTTGKPVKVAFTLPDGSPRRVKVHRNQLEFDYRGKDISIRFLRDGEVRVRD